MAANRCPRTRRGRRRRAPRRRAGAAARGRPGGSWCRSRQRLDGIPAKTRKTSASTSGVRREAQDRGGVERFTEGIPFASASQKEQERPVEEGRVYNQVEPARVPPPRRTNAATRTVRR